MKKLLLIATCMLASMAAYAQGTVTFANGASTLVTFGTTPDVPTALQGVAVPTGTAATPSDFRAALYWLNPGTSAFEQLGAAVSIAPVAGRFSGGTRTTGAGTAAGASGTFMVKVWSGGTGFSSYEAAVASGSASVFVGESSSFSNGTGGAGSPPGPALALSGFTGINNVRPVPEPSVIALGILGAAALLLRRRN
jgi:hypothetical protein